MSVTHFLLLIGVGLCAGAINSVAGGGTLIAYPALLASGLTATAANVTSLVGLTWGYVGSGVAYRDELREQRTRLRQLSLPALAGGVAGAGLLLTTPDGVFRRVVPFLVLLSCILLLLQPLTMRWLRTSQTGSRPWLPLLLVGLAGIYGAYFSAGLGVLLLALLGSVLTGGLQQMNALKSAISLIIVLAGVAVYLTSSQIDWLAVAAIMPGAALGGLAGGRLARMLNPTALRWGVCVLGTALAVILFIRST